MSLQLQSIFLNNNHLLKLMECLPKPSKHSAFANINSSQTDLKHPLVFPQSSTLIFANGSTGGAVGKG